MSGGHFDYTQYQISEIADTIERDIKRALKPKPNKIHEDYWTIYQLDNLHSYHCYDHYLTFPSAEKAKEFLFRDQLVKEIEPKYREKITLFKEWPLFQSQVYYMHGTKEIIPRMYAIYHCVYDHYPSDEDVLELEDKTIKTMKEAYKQLKIAEIYAQRIDWMMSGDDGEDTMQKRLKEELNAFNKEFASKDWTFQEEEE